MGDMELRCTECFNHNGAYSVWGQTQAEYFGKSGPIPHKRIFLHWYNGEYLTILIARIAIFQETDCAWRELSRLCLRQQFLKATGANAVPTYRAISLLSLARKVYANYVHWKRCCEILEPKLEDTQCGFLPDRSTADHIFILQQIFEKKSSEYAKDVYAPFACWPRQSTRPGRSWKDFGIAVGVTAVWYWPSSHYIPA